MPARLRSLPLLLLLAPSLSRAADPGTAGFGKKGFTISDASGNNTLNVHLRFQPRYVFTTAGDSEVPDAEATSAGFRIRRMPLILDGQLAGQFRYVFRVDFAKSFSFTDADAKSQDALKPILDDAQVVYGLADPVELAVGQFKVGAIAQYLTADLRLAFPERSLPVEGLKYGDVSVSGFSYQRDIGAQLQGGLAEKKLEYQLGVFNGDGANRWPPSDTGHLYSARVVVAPLGELKLDEIDVSGSEPRVALGASANLNQHPVYTDAGDADGSEGDLRLGGELRAAARGFALQAEGFYGSYSYTDGTDPLTRLGAYAQVSYLLPVGVAPAVRFAMLDPDRATEEDAVQAIDVALNVFLRDPAAPGEILGHEARLTLGYGTALHEAADEPLYHQGTAAAVLAF